MRAQLTILIFAAVLTCTCDAQGASTSPDQNEKIFTVGAILPLTGDSYNHGTSAQIALRMAEADMNQLFSDLGRSVRISVVVKDSQTDPDVALKALKELQARGIRVIIGPEDSESLSHIREYANESGIILISCASTAPSLAIENDTTFRLVPDDAFLAHLLAVMMHRDGIKVLIPLARRDLWADNMLNATRNDFERDGGIMLEAVRYDPETTDFSDELNLLHSDVNSAIKANGADFVAVYVSSFDEIVDILSQAASDPVLSSVRWYGNDLAAFAISQDENASEFAVSTHFLFPVFGGRGGQKSEEIKREVMNETGGDASSLVVNDYDALRLITYTYLVAGSDDPETFKRAFPLVAGTYRGEFGWMKLNSAGDLEGAPFTLEYLEKDNGSFRWMPYAIL